jgi:NAD(P)-dependent dehydrogenase (short-subunit alcohol dehydrogenase family)
MLPFLDASSVAVVIGASGGIGAALVSALRQHTAVGSIIATGHVHEPATLPGVETSMLDILDEDALAALAERASAVGSVRLVLVASGLLHTSSGLAPEKSWRALDLASLQEVFAVNTFGPALVGKHFLPLLPRQGRAIFAALSARVGSIEDNRLGGWHAYRASKAALNMLLRNFSIELARRAPEAVCVGLHPGTVDTPLSSPFQRAVKPQKLFTPKEAALHLLKVLDGLAPADSGDVYAWDGQRIPA